MPFPYRRRRLAWAGVAGPVAFVASWAGAGALTPGYDPVGEPVSRLAAAGAPHRSIMNTGFLVFAAAMPVYALPLRSALAGPAWLAALAAGLGSAGIAATPVGFSDGLDTAHAAAAVSTYVAMATLPVMAGRSLAGAGRRRLARVSAVTGVVAGACLAASIVTEPTGLWQRTGLTLVDAWIVASALAILAGKQE